MNEADERGRCAVMVINSVHILLLHCNVLSHYVVENMGVRAGHIFVPPGAVCRATLCWTEYELTFEQRHAYLFLQDVYSVFREVSCQSYDSSSVFLQCAPLRFIFNGDFLFIALHHVLAFICMLWQTLENVDVEVVGIDNL